jgi:hypothetical protein
MPLLPGAVVTPDLLYFTAIITVLTLSAWVHITFTDQERELLALARDTEAQK